VARNPKTWTCQKQSGGAKCGAKNPKIKRNCQVCGKPRPKTKKPSHMQALEIPYETYIILNGGEFCGICGAKRGAKRRLDKDHAHDREGKGHPRGLLCWRHNSLLSNNDWTPELLRAAADYLERAERRRGVNLDAFL
jgi:CRISPR/Cas system-associated protein Cas10 (large subunit of type III CRISPR-Cas system)